MAFLSHIWLAWVINGLVCYVCGGYMTPSEEKKSLHHQLCFNSCSTFWCLTVLLILSWLYSNTRYKINLKKVFFREQKEISQEIMTGKIGWCQIIFLVKHHIESCFCKIVRSVIILLLYLCSWHCLETGTCKHNPVFNWYFNWAHWYMHAW